MKARVSHRTFVPGLLVATLVWTSGIPVWAGHIPTHGDVTHFDLNPAGDFDLLSVPAVPSVSFADGLDSPSLFHWQTEIRNPHDFPIRFFVGFFFPEGGPVLGALDLATGGTFNIDIHVQDASPEVRPWLWSATSDFLGVAIEIDTSVTEDNAAGPETPGSFDFSVSGAGSVFNEHTFLPEVAFSLIPAPGAALLAMLGLPMTGWVRRRFAA